MSESQPSGQVPQPVPVRRKLPAERKAITHHFEIAGNECFVTVGLYEDGMPGEIFLTMAKEGSTISGFADAFAQAVSVCLQHGVPLQVLVTIFSHVRFEPSGITKNAEVRFAKSIVDYIFRYLEAKFLKKETTLRAVEPITVPDSDAPPCTTCGTIMTRSGACWRCSHCGTTTGCV